MRNRLGMPVCGMLALMCLTAGWAEPLPSAAPGESFDVTLEGGAVIAGDEQLETDVLELDGREGSYAHWASPQGWGRPRNFRVDVRVRLDQIRASSIPIAMPGSFMIYLNGQGKPWFLFFTDTGRHVIAAGEPITPTVWTHIAVEYRADDVCLLSVNGRSVASTTGRGLLKPGEGRLWLGRYYYKDPKDEKEYAQWMKGAVGLPRITLLPDDDRYEADLSSMSNVMSVSWGDAIVVNKGWRMLNKPEHVAPFVQECKRLGVKQVYLRCSSEFIMNFCELRMDEDHWYMKALRAVEGDMYSEFIKGCHEAGIKVLAWSTIFDEGSPTSVKYGGNTPFFWQSHFTIEHPEYLMESRDGKTRQWGVLCYAYPEAREHIIGVFKHIMDKWPFDGLYICTRTHSYPAKFADELGYNQPIVDEFKRRHGVDIRTEPFSKSQWWDLQGEYLTQLLREFRQQFAGKQIVIGIPRSDYIGPPYGNMRLDWRTWVAEGIIDGLRLDTISGGWHYPDTRNLPGYVQSQQDNVAMRELEYDLGQWFGPACKDAGVELYTSRSSIYSDADQDLLKHPGVTGFALNF